MIRSFRCKETEKIWNERDSKRIPREIQQRSLIKLQLLNAAEEPRDLMQPPGNRLEALKGERKGYFSIRINQQWRICFRWAGTDAHDVEIVDYH